MTLLDQMDTDLDKVFFDKDRGFAEECETPASTINVLFDEEYYLSQPDTGIGVSSFQPVASMKKKDADTLEVGHILYIRQTEYSIIEFQDSGDGEVLAILRKQ